MEKFHQKLEQISNNFKFLYGCRDLNVTIECHWTWIEIEFNMSWTSFISKNWKVSKH